MEYLHRLRDGIKQEVKYLKDLLEEGTQKPSYLKEKLGKMSEILKKLWKLVQRFWFWLKSFFNTYYSLKVSYNATWGDADDQEFIVKKFIKKQPKFISFITEEGELVEISGADGLNYRIQQL